MATHAEFGAKATASEVTNAFSGQIKGLTVLVTGVNPKGLGCAVVKAIAEHHPAHIIITGRTQEKLDAVIKDLAIGFPKVRTTSVTMDLSSFRSVRNAAAKINNAVDVIDVLFNNAGIMALPEREVSENGFEMHLATNHIGHFLLTNLILPKIRLAAAKRPGSTRIVTVTSLGYQFSPFRLQDYNFDGHPVAADEVGVEEWLSLYRYPAKPFPSYDSMIAYGQSKTANLLFSTYLAKHLASDGITVLTIHPG
ncbi:hypothetical protein AJ78_06210, partial [Emergomyces pasteurianus Ep9510]